MKRLYTSNDLAQCIAQKYLLLDNDFLSELYNDATILGEIIRLFSDTKAWMLIDPIVEFEFLREVFLPKQRTIKSSFLHNKVFLPATKPSQVNEKILDNALLLSKIYAQHKKTVKSPSYVDLQLAGRVMLQAPTTCLITGNIRDFSQKVFDISSLITLPQNDGDVKNYAILTFNQNKFTECIHDLEKLERENYQATS